MNSQGRAGSNDWKWPLWLQPGTLAVGEHTGGCCGSTAASTPLAPGQSRHPLSSVSVTEGGLSPALRGSHSLPLCHLYTSCLWIILPTVLKATRTFPCLCSVPQPPHLILPDLLAGQDQTPFSCLIHRLLLMLLYMNAFPQSHKTHSFPQKIELLRGFLLSETFKQVRAGGTLSLRGASFIPEKAGEKCKRFLKNRRYFHHHQLSLPHVVQHLFQIRYYSCVSAAFTLPGVSGDQQTSTGDQPSHFILTHGGTAF